MFADIYTASYPTEHQAKFSFAEPDSPDPDGLLPTLEATIHLTDPSGLFPTFCNRLRDCFANHRLARPRQFFNGDQARSLLPHLV